MFNYTKQENTAIYLTNTCDSQSITFNSADVDLNSTGTISATTAIDNATQSYFAFAVDAAGNISNCSNEVTFTHDTISPVPVVTLSSTEGEETALNFSVSNLDTGGEIYLFAGSCVNGQITGAIGLTTSSTSSIDVSSYLVLNEAIEFFAIQKDGLGNLSDCSPSLSYKLVDTTPPNAISDFTMTSESPSANVTTPSFEFTKSNDATHVYLLTSCDSSVRESVKSDYLANVAEIESVDYSAEIQNYYENISPNPGGGCFGCHGSGDNTNWYADGYTGEESSCEDQLAIIQSLVNTNSTWSGKAVTNMPFIDPGNPCNSRIYTVLDVPGSTCDPSWPSTGTYMNGQDYYPGVNTGLIKSMIENYNVLECPSSTVTSTTSSSSYDYTDLNSITTSEEVTNSTQDFYAVQVDASGNVSDCSGVVSFTNDTIADAPVISRISPTSDSSENQFNSVISN